MKKIEAAKEHGLLSLKWDQTHADFYEQRNLKAMAKEFAKILKPKSI